MHTRHLPQLSSTTPTHIIIPHLKINRIIKQSLTIHKCPPHPKIFPKDSDGLLLGKSSRGFRGDGLKIVHVSVGGDDADDSVDWVRVQAEYFAVDPESL